MSVNKHIANNKPNNKKEINNDLYVINSTMQPRFQSVTKSTIDCPGCAIYTGVSIRVPKLSTILTIRCSTTSARYLFVLLSCLVASRIRFQFAAKLRNPASKQQANQ
ncbi:hypothetical protein DPMN_056002 [Dreissena polymorpha]|uniref:Uncharacterized protein n=1 Tax=Dreissena polymorpha TaxID=45954 RepID=A0A9D4CQY2_DREPO|nr:hypothetical protein DPMN_056002 [Dreissena polymorpha]